MKCRLHNPDDESSCQNDAVAGGQHFPFCGDKCHEEWADKNHPVKKSNFEAFLKRGRDHAQMQRIIDFDKNSI